MHKFFLTIFIVYAAIAIPLAFVSASVHFDNGSKSIYVRNSSIVYCSRTHVPFDNPWPVTGCSWQVTSLLALSSDADIIAYPGETYTTIVDTRLALFVVFFIAMSFRWMVSRLRRKVAQPNQEVR